MKHIMTFEMFSIEEIYNWWLGIKVSEDDNYYILDLNNVYLSNKIIQLNSGLKNKVVSFYCDNHMEKHELKIKRIEIHDKKLIFHTYDSDTHITDTARPIKISKIYINTDKYNL
jgi:hypothetical protein